MVTIHWRVIKDSMVYCHHRQCLFICPQPFQKLDVESRRDLWSKTPVRKGAAVSAQLLCRCHMLGGGTGKKRNHSSEGPRLSSMAVQLGCRGETCEWHQQWTMLQRSVWGTLHWESWTPCAEGEAPLCVCGVRGKGPGNLSGILHAFEVEKGQLDCQRHREVINGRRREEDARTLHIFPQHF